MARRQFKQGPWRQREDLFKRRFAMIPDAFFRFRVPLGITNDEALMVIHVLRYQCTNSAAFPSNSTIAKEMGTSVRSLHRWKARLVEKGFLVSEGRYSGGRQTSSRWDFSPLVDKLYEMQFGTKPDPQFFSDISDTPSVPEMTGREGDKNGIPIKEKDTTYLSLDKREEGNVALYARYQAPASRVPGEAGLEGSQGGEKKVKEEEKLEKKIKGNFGENSGKKIKASEPEITPVGHDSCMREEEEATEDVQLLMDIVGDAVAKGRKQRTANTKKKEAKEARTRNLKGSEQAPAQKAKSRESERIWWEEFKQIFPHVETAPWGVKERSIHKQLGEKYSANLIPLTICYVLRNWNTISSTMFKGRGGVPSLGMILRFHDKFFVEAQMWAERERLEREIREWKQSRGGKPPRELMNRKRELLKNLEKAGLNFGGK